MYDFQIYWFIDYETKKVRNNGSTKQRKYETNKNTDSTKQWKCETAKVRNNETTRVRNNKSAKLRNNERAKGQDGHSRTQ